MDFDAIEETHEVQVKHTGIKPGNPEENLQNSMLRNDVRLALEKLPADYREALFLSLVEGFSYREIAEMDALGRVDAGDVSRDLLRSVPRAPYGVATDLGRFETALDRATAAAKGSTGPALVVLDPGVDMLEKDLIKECQKRLESFMVPKMIVVVPELPKTTTGKIKRQGFAAESGSQRAGAVA